MKKITLLIFVTYFCFNFCKTISEEATENSFPQNFTSGVLETGVDCENIEFFPDGKFVYKFTGDCKGWGRTVKGNWKKDKEKILLTATFFENKIEGEIGCAGSYYHENTLSEKKECFKKYKNGIKEKFDIFPAIFDLTGYVWVTEKDNIGVSIQTYLSNNPKKGKIKGIMFFEDLNFGKFSNIYNK
ncbi:hypothetical protein EHQ19_00105 [Leptospira montravelensis]|uniref:hypothetical protein n=1 Tax=Leptospira montravelensis TaxID=2484961 RepID=UPI0010842EEB|nr:hypothetical protein [Leptospira montravelensis]TGK87181.1 hypothetical protein EHQ19_00105 [Leptospira montravelensis]